MYFNVIENYEARIENVYNYGVYDIDMYKINNN